MIYRKFTGFVGYFLRQTSTVLFVCILFTLFSLVIDGNLWRLWNLHNDQGRLVNDISKISRQIEKIDQQLKKAKDPTYIERAAYDKLDLVGQEDLVFVFSEPE